MVPARLVQVIDLLGVDVEAARGDGVQQRLPHVRPRAIHQHHLHAAATALPASQPRGELEAAGAAANDHDAVQVGRIARGALPDMASQLASAHARPM